MSSSNMHDIRTHIKTVQETMQITKAMHLISTAKMQKAMKRYDANAVYLNQVRQTMKDMIAHRLGGQTHPFLQERADTTAAHIVIAGDKGLAGGYNHNVLNLAAEHMKGHEELSILTVGQIAREFLTKKGYMVDVEFLHVAQNPTLDNARQITDTVINMFKQNLLNQVYICYTKMISPIKQEARVMRLLPVYLSDFDDVEDLTPYEGEMLFEPDARTMFDYVVPQYIIGVIYSCLVQSYASEHCARMQAMDAATRNAEEMIEKLQKQYNRARQNAITEEINEIVSGTEAQSRRG